ncbi:uncharacterized protein LOC110099547 [Dendrobium catenatum]|uniref:uncharacterized protein LOC110099547 n=1 Tax=Dendrobium catenatum TaxID=906689 RepID=UPI00109F0800|nr:uncharacterized protein LOC110099547 [Dendrobium catenatum]
MAKEPISTAGGSATTRLVVHNNETIRAFLLVAAADEQRLSGELRDIASDLSSQSSVPYRSLRSVWSALPVGARPSLTALFSGAEFLFSSPKPREKSEELKERLRKLAEMAERKEYEELVKDVAPRMEKAEPFSSYKDQIGFGMPLFFFFLHCSKTDAYFRKTWIIMYIYGSIGDLFLR